MKIPKLMATNMAFFMKESELHEMIHKWRYLSSREMTTKNPINLKK